MINYAGWVIPEGRVIKVEDESGNIQWRHTHSFLSGWVIDKAASCTGAGEKHRTCSIYGCIESESIPATGHSETNIPGKSATCTESGLTTGKKCSVCGAITVAQTTIAATGHTEVSISGKAATCISTGLTAGKKCSVCGTIITAQQVIPITDHTYQILTNSEECSVCGHVLRRFGVALHSNPAALEGGYRDIAVTSTGNHAIFGGGCSTSSTSSYSASVTAYDRSLTRTVPTALSLARKYLAAASIGGYALFGGGCQGTTGSTIYSTVDAYNSSLTRSIPTALSEVKYHVAAASIGGYALFAGGRPKSSSYTSVVDTYNSSLTRGSAAALAVARSEMGAATNANYALFACGYSSPYTYYQADAYNTSLTRSTAPELSEASTTPASASTRNYAVFKKYTSRLVDAFDTSLSIHYPTDTTLAFKGATSTGDYVLFGGSGTAIDVYDGALTRLDTNLKGTNRTSYIYGSSVGSYALFAGQGKVLDAFINYDLQ